MQKKSIQYGFQFRDDSKGIIVNWYPKKGTVYVQKNEPNLNFPSICFNESDLIKCFQNTLVQQQPTLEKPKSGICSDAGTHGNPGPSEYNIAMMDGTVLQHEHLGVHSNNYAELYGIYAGLNYCKENNEQALWTDSQVCLTWIKNKRVGKDVHEREDVLEIISKINQLLDSTSISLKKWDTKKWGEIPADFGRK